MKKLTTKDSQMVQSTQKWMKKNLLSSKFYVKIDPKNTLINCRSYNIYDYFSANLKFVRNKNAFL